jgi:hypothetical protein
LAFKTAYETGLGAYHSRQFQEAVAVFSRLKETHPRDKSVDELIHRCGEALANPPSDDSDLTFRFKTK